MINANFFVKKIKQVYYVAKSKRFISQLDLNNLHNIFFHYGFSFPFPVCLSVTIP